MPHFGTSFNQMNVQDERISSIRLNWGRESRPLWECLERLNPGAQLKWIDRLSVYESLASEWALALAYERAIGISPGPRAEHIRALLGELQRLIWGAEVLHRIFRAISDRVRVEQALRIRESLFQGQEVFTGSRILPQVMQIGGLERDLSAGDVRKFRDLLKNVEFEFRIFFRDLFEDPSFTSRLEGVFPLARRDMMNLGVGGFVGQASRNFVDLRTTGNYGAYNQLLVKPYIPEEEYLGDALTRVRAIHFHFKQSLNLCYNLLLAMPEGNVRGQTDPTVEGLNIESQAEIEGASGPVKATIAGSRIRIVTNSMRIAPQIEKLLVGVHYQDVELALASIGFHFEEADLL